MDRHVVAVHPDTGLEEVSALFVKYGFRSIPVVDAENRFQGAVSFRSASPVLARQLHL